MGIQLTELISYLDQQLQPQLYSDYCPNGLQIEGKPVINKLATAVSVNLETIEAAIEQHVDALIVHHGLFWSGDSYVIKGSKLKKIQKLLQHGISLIAYHLPLDAHQTFGNNWKAAQELGWKDLQPFGNYKGTYIGVKGSFPAIERDKFKNKLTEYYQHQAHAVEGGKESVSSAALISGGAYKSLSEAAAIGIDCFVTGNFDEPAWYLAKEEGINFFAMGHAATERIGPKALAEHLQKQLKLTSQFIDINNPF